MKTLLTILLISLFSFSAQAKECFNDGGLFSGSAILAYNNCPSGVKQEFKSPNTAIKKVKCGIFYTSELFLSDGCVVVLGGLNDIGAKNINGYVIINKVCKEYSCNAVYVMNFKRIGDVPKEEPPQSRPIAPKPGQEKDIE